MSKTHRIAKIKATITADKDVAGNPTFETRSDHKPNVVFDSATYGAGHFWAWCINERIEGARQRGGNHSA